MKTRAKCLGLLMTVLGFLPLSKGGCRALDYLECIKNKVFTGHVIKSVSVLEPGIETCQRQCFNDKLCVSYNLGPINGCIRQCELSSSDHLTFPNALKENSSYEYCPIKNPCASKSCPSGSPYCYPDFEKDEIFCRDGQWGSWGKFECACPLKRSRQCLSPDGRSANDCGPGGAYEIIPCVKKPDCLIFDFESGSLAKNNWTLTGNAFNNQPTYGDNRLAREGRKVNMKGNWYVGTFENRPDPSKPAGRIQGFSPKGTATSPEFVIKGRKIKFLLSGGSFYIKVQLLVNQKAVITKYPSTSTGEMIEQVMYVRSYKGQTGRIRLIDDRYSSFINVDHFYFEF